MTTLSRIRGFSFRATVAAGVALSLVGTAWAITSGNFIYSKARSGYFTIDSMAMTPTSDEEGNRNHYNDWNVGLKHFDATDGCYQTAVNLPHDAILKSITVWVTSGGSQDAFITLDRKKLASGSLAVLASSDKNAFADGVRDGVNFIINPANATVNNVAYSYGFGICLNQDDIFHGARIRYTYTSAGD